MRNSPASIRSDEERRPAERDRCEIDVQRRTWPFASLAAIHYPLVCVTALNLRTSDASRILPRRTHSCRRTILPCRANAPTNVQRYTYGTNSLREAVALLLVSIFTHFRNDIQEVTSVHTPLTIYIPISRLFESFCRIPMKDR